jgi:D-glycero-alpha-D-manno-heptose-7-phosphate kinase
VIVSRAPFRFSLGGGGSDLPAYYGEHGGFVVSAAIYSYMYVTANVDDGARILLNLYRAR